MKYIDKNSRRTRAITANGTIFMGGQVASDFDSGIRIQTEQALGKIDELLAEAGSRRNKVVHVTIWLKSMDDYGIMNEVWDAWVDKEHPPTRACCEVPMADERILVEFIPTAVI